MFFGSKRLPPPPPIRCDTCGVHLERRRFKQGLQAKYCPIHRQEAKRRTWRESQRRYRERSN